MTDKQAWIAAGVGGAVLAFGYLLTKREINANVSSEAFTLTYKVAPRQTLLKTGDAGATSPTGPIEKPSDVDAAIQHSAAIIHKDDHETGVFDAHAALIAIGLAT